MFHIGTDCLWFVTVPGVTPKYFSFLIFKGGACWLYVNLYKVESSLKTLALKFGNLSTNKANITIFITMLQGFRFTLEGEELVIHSYLHSYSLKRCHGCRLTLVCLSSGGDDANIRMSLQKGKVAI